MEDSLRRWEKHVDSDGKFPWAIYDFKTVRMNRTARHVYVDMGANWANTLRLWQDMGIKGENSSWEVYAFEASPLIQPYVERFTQWLNGKGSKPELTVPPAGSSAELNQYAARCGCPTGDLDAMRQCMWKTFEAQLNRLAPDPALNSSTLIEARLAEAKVRSPEQNRYTFIPAAVGVKDTYVSLSETSAKQMIRGGAHSVESSTSTVRVRAVDVVSWLKEHFLEEDYVFLKMDVECAEHDIIEALVTTGGWRLIDQLAWECHSGCGDCVKTRRKLQVATGAEIIEEGQGGFHGYDSSSSPDKYYANCNSTSSTT